MHLKGNNIMVKSICLYIITLLYCLRYTFNKQIAINGTILQTTINIKRKNRIKIAGHVHYCKLMIDGNDNHINTNGNVCHTIIKINGINNNVVIEDGVIIEKAKIVIRGSNCCVTIKKGTTIGSAYIVCMGKKNSITVEEECMLAENIDIWSTDAHPIYKDDGKIVNPSRPINIGKHVWLGKGSRILKGVNIGTNSIIAMGAIVTADIPNNTICAGIPAKVIKENVNWNKQFIEI